MKITREFHHILFFFLPIKLSFVPTWCVYTLWLDLFSFSSCDIITQCLFWSNQLTNILQQNSGEKNNRERKHSTDRFTGPPPGWWFFFLLNEKSKRNRNIFRWKSNVRSEWFFFLLFNIVLKRVGFDQTHHHYQHQYSFYSF